MSLRSREDLLEKLAFARIFKLLELHEFLQLRLLISGESPSRDSLELQGLKGVISSFEFILWP